MTRLQRALVLVAIAVALASGLGTWLVVWYEIHTVTPNGLPDAGWMWSAVGVSVGVVVIIAVLIGMTTTWEFDGVARKSGKTFR